MTHLAKLGLSRKCEMKRRTLSARYSSSDVDSNWKLTVDSTRFLQIGHLITITSTVR
jgi:hypothetical protein